MYKTVLLLGSFFLIYIKCEDCDKLGVLLYEDLGCKPQSVRGKSCPTHFECDDFAKSNQSCLFRSQKIAVGDSVKDDLIYSSCKIGCRCEFEENRNVTQFNCAILDCPEWLGDDFPGPDCYLTHKLGECCASGHKCPPYDNKTKCVVDGKEYNKDEMFYPPNTCLSCICKEDFTGKFEAPFCKRTLCAVQMDDSDKVAENCAPVYLHGETLCCPSEWVCPSNSDTIKQIGPKTSSKSNLNCKWGKLQLELGEGLQTKIDYFGTVKDITCECVLPPLLTCKETKK